jgi:hydroxymethylbilane synthase
MNPIRLITRKSPLAQAQATIIQHKLAQLTKTSIQVITTNTPGDQHAQTPIWQLGGKGSFVQSLDQAVLNDQADAAVHCVKDCPAQLPEGLIFAAIDQRAAVHDCLVGLTNFPDTTKPLTIGTSSIRRQQQWLMIRPQDKVQAIRGNIDTRLNQLGQLFDAIILAAAGLERLERCVPHTPLPLIPFPPACGQAAIGVVCRQDSPYRDLLAQLNHQDSACAIDAERQVIRGLGAQCLAPISVYAIVKGFDITISAAIYDAPSPLIHQTITGPACEFKQLADQLTMALIKQGTLERLKKFKSINL